MIQNTSSHEKSSGVVEPLSEEQRKNIVVDVKGLKKNFGDFWAVDGLNLSFVEGQISGLLGHNGMLYYLYGSWKNSLIFCNVYVIRCRKDYSYFYAYW